MAYSKQMIAATLLFFIMTVCIVNCAPIVGCPPGEYLDDVVIGHCVKCPPMDQQSHFLSAFVEKHPECLYQPLTDEIIKTLPPTPTTRGQQGQELPGFRNEVAIDNTITITITGEPTIDTDRTGSVESDYKYPSWLTPVICCAVVFAIASMVVVAVACCPGHTKAKFDKYLAGCLQLAASGEAGTVPSHAEDASEMDSLMRSHNAAANSVPTDGAPNERNDGALVDRNDGARDDQSDGAFDDRRDGSDDPSDQSAEASTDANDEAPNERNAEAEASSDQNNGATTHVDGDLNDGISESTASVPESVTSRNRSSASNEPNMTAIPQNLMVEN